MIAKQKVMNKMTKKKIAKKQDIKKILPVKKKKKIAKNRGHVVISEYKKKKKPSYPKGLTIRYNKNDEKELLDLMERTDDKTMTKALLKTPRIMRRQQQLIERQVEEIQAKNDRIYELEEILSSWLQFNKKLESFINKRGEQVAEKED